MKNIKVYINKQIQDSIRNSKDGEATLAMLIQITRRPNTEYNRGIIHGYLFALTTQGIINNSEAIALLEQIER